ncbi:Urease operon accessory protein, partial [Rhizobium ruizarguesonis]
LAVSHPELDDFCDDYTADFSAFCADTGKRHVVIGKAVHEAFDASLSAFAPSPYVVPSSGMIVIADVAKAGKCRLGFGICVQH